MDSQETQTQQNPLPPSEPVSEKPQDVFEQVFGKEPSSLVGEKAEKEQGKTHKKGRGAKKIYRTILQGRAYVQATYNNTMVTITDMNGNALGWSSAGACGFKGPKKATAYAAGVVIRNVAEKVRPYGLRDMDVFVKGIGSGREAAIRALNTQGFTVLSIKDMTPIPHNGCRPRKIRRV